MTIECDVLVIGGGPAGSSAARAAAKNGAKTILIEKQKRISNVPCAEGIGSYLFPLLPFKIPKNQLIWPIKGILFSDGETEIIQEGNFYKGWSIDREKFDNWLLNLAEKNGANILMNTEFKELYLNNNNHVEKVIAKKDNKELIIKPKTIIAADGVESKFAEKLGILKKQKDSIGYVYSWEMKNIELKYLYYEQMFFGDFAPRAYAYIFPKSKNTANIGVGSIEYDKELEKKFNTFLEDIIPKQVKKGIKTIDRSGKAPVKTMIETIHYGNVLFAGDAANQNFKPYVEGILPSIICGDIAGKTVINNENKYEEKIKKKLGRQFKDSDRLLEKLLEVDKYEYEKKNLLSMYMFAFLNGDIIDELSHKSIDMIKNELFNKSREVNSFVTMLKFIMWYTKILATRRN
jgi:digeranylgeranylglycerophospholipid reductase